jgi:hypothetical protein
MWMTCVGLVVGWFVCGAIAACLHVKLLGKDAHFIAFKEFFALGCFGLVGMILIILTDVSFKIPYAKIGQTLTRPIYIVSEFCDKRMETWFLWLKAK